MREEFLSHCDLIDENAVLTINLLIVIVRKSLSSLDTCLMEVFRDLVFLLFL